MSPEQAVRRNDTTIYDTRAAAWWDFSDPIFVPLYAMVTARRAYLQRHRISFAGMRVLDVGAGGGYVSALLAEQGAAPIVALDFAFEALRAGRSHLDHPSIQWLRGTATALPCPDASFDAVVCTDVLVHVPDAARVLREVGRVLRPGGTFWFSTVAKTRLARFVLVTLGEDILRIVHRGTHDPALFLGPSELEPMLADGGMRLVASGGLGPTGIGRSGLTMGRWPTRAVMWQGHAIKP